MTNQPDIPFLNQKNKQRYRAGAVDSRNIKDSLETYRASLNKSPLVQIIRPFSVTSKNNYSAPVTLPIGPAYLAAVLEQAGYPVEIIDGVGENIYQFTRSDCGNYNMQGLTPSQIIDRLSPEVKFIGVSLMFSQEWLMHRELIKNIHMHFPNATIVAGGEHVSALPEYVLRDCPEIDFAITGEGELTFLNLVHSLSTDTDPSSVPGCAYIDADGAYVTNGLSRRITSLGEMPRPAWHLCPVTNYFIDNWTMGISQGRNMPILATRGCPYQCTFCSNPTMWTTRYEMRPVNSVVDEIQHLVDTYDANSIDFFDLTAIVKKQWVLDFCAELKNRKIKIIWQLPSGTRSEALDNETLVAIKEAGCRFLVYAPESGSDETLKAIKKKIKLPSITYSIRQAVQAGHVVKVNLIIGFPHERLKHVLSTIAYALRMAVVGAEDCNIAKFSPYPGSELFRDLQANQTIGEVDDDYIRSLVSQFDMVRGATFCPNVPTTILRLSSIIGHALFYSTAYLLHPQRIYRIIKGMLRSSFTPKNLFEQRLYDLYMRSKLIKLHK